MKLYLSLHRKHKQTITLKTMKTLTITIEKANVKQAWGEHIAEAGFENWKDFNKYGKKNSVWSKDGENFTAKTSRDSNDNLIITLTEYK